MIDKVRSWLSQNHTLVIFLVGQGVAILAVAISIVAYMVRLETRVNTLEIRGSPHLADINTRLTVLEGQTKNNKQSVERIIDVMTKELHVSPQRENR